MTACIPWDDAMAAVAIGGMVGMLVMFIVVLWAIRP